MAAASKVRLIIASSWSALAPLFSASAVGPFRRGKLGDHICVLHLAAMCLVLAHEERLERSQELFEHRALLVGLHVGNVVPQADREAGVLVTRVLDEQATAEPLDRLAIGDVRSIVALELVPRSGAKPAPRNPDHHGRPPSRTGPRCRPFTSIVIRVPRPVNVASHLITPPSWGKVRA